MFVWSTRRRSPQLTIVHQSTISGMFEDALVQIARKHEFTRFVKLSYLDAEMDPISVPAVLAYKAGDLIANLVSIVDEMPMDATINASNLEHVLQRSVTSSHRDDCAILTS